MRNLGRSVSIFFCVTLVSSAAMAEGAKLVEKAQFGHHQGVGLTFSNQDRMFVTFPRSTGGKELRYALAEIVNGQEVPYPDASWNVFDVSKPDQSFLNVQATLAYGNDLWVLDTASPQTGLAVGKNVKFLRIDLRDNKIKDVYGFEDLPVGETNLNDFRVDNQRGLAYFTDPKSASLVILDLNSRKARMVLTKDRSTLADPDRKLFLDGQFVVDRDGKPYSSNANGIALTSDGVWLYYRAVTQEHLYRIETRYLADANLSKTELASHVEDVGRVGISHGMWSDDKGNIYLSDSENYAVDKVAPDGTITRVVQDARLSWPDTFASDSKGNIYITASQFNRTERFNQIERTEFPYRAYMIDMQYDSSNSH